MEGLLRTVLARASLEVGIELSEEQLELCERFAELVVKGNEQLNLTSLVDPSDMAIKHFVDSFTCLGVGAWPKGARAVDVGTGAGFPGVALSILRPDMDWVLVDSQRKRVDFLGESVASLGLSRLQVMHCRAEELGRLEGFRESFDVSVARAVARLPVLLEYCLPLVRKGGGFLAMKGAEGQEEVWEAERAAEVLGGGRPCVTRLELPGAAGLRTLVWYAKTHGTPEKYPRRAGMPLKRPL